MNFTDAFRICLQPALDVRRVAAEQPENHMNTQDWQPISTAPKLGQILLWFPDMRGWLAGPWRGMWSYVAKEWVISTPFHMDDKHVDCSGLPQPTHWQPLPPPPTT